MLQVSGRKLTTADHFTQQLIDAGQLIYQHDGSDDTSDHLTFSLGLTILEVSLTNLERPPQIFTFNISVLPVDDQPFRLVTMSPQIQLVQGSAQIITRASLLTLDEDTSPGQIVYKVNMRATNGHLLHADLHRTDDVSQFTQFDVDQMKIAFVSDGTLGNSSFRFQVSDGAHKPLDKVDK